MVGTLEDEYVSLSTGELQAVAWAPTLHMSRSILLSLIPMNINEPIWSRTSQISEAISLQTLKLSQQNTSNCLITLYLPGACCWPKREHMIFDLTLGPGAAPACWSNSDYIWLVTMDDVQQICWNCIAILQLLCHCTSDVKSYLIYLHYYIDSWLRLNPYKVQAVSQFECFETCPSLLSGMCQS